MQNGAEKMTISPLHISSIIIFAYWSTYFVHRSSTHADTQKVTCQKLWVKVILCDARVKWKFPDLYRLCSGIGSSVWAGTSLFMSKQYQLSGFKQGMIVYSRLIRHFISRISLGTRYPLWGKSCLRDKRMNLLVPIVQCPDEPWKIHNRTQIILARSVRGNRQ